MRTGAPWRDLPSDYGPWQTVYGLFRRWQRQGVRFRLLTLLQVRAEMAGLIVWDVNVDSTICRAHQHAAGGHRDGAGQEEPPGGAATEPDDHGLGRSRGGFTTKIRKALGLGRARAADVSLGLWCPLAEPAVQAARPAGAVSRGCSCRCGRP
ncbi:transposase [Streptomyces sp. AD681]|uniref:transposase n=1 Tax=Streptomyces sp. AD681 TaxID=3019069 RepID=UPI003FA6F39F